MGYDLFVPLKRMSMRFVIATVLTLVASATEAQEHRAAAVWSAVVTPPRAALPPVTVEVGYRDGYVPLETPLTIRATAGSRPFDGYIGFHFRAGMGARTSDSPVFARARIAAGEAWTISTFTKVGQRTVQKLPRELVIEWRDASRKTLASAGAGTPPWSGRKRRLVIDSQGASRDVFGDLAHVEAPASLSPLAQWYAPFSGVVIDLETWLDLPAEIRRAIFGSRREVIFIGFPRVEQKLDEITNALLPLALQKGASSYRAPWPYGSGETMAAPASWKPDADALALRGDGASYLIRSRHASWVADRRALDHPLPELHARSARQKDERQMPREWASVRSQESTSTWPGAIALLRRYAEIGLLVLAWSSSIAVWFLVTRRSRPLIGGALLTVALITIAVAARPQRARRALESVVIEVTEAHSSLTDVFVEIHQAGASPLDPVRLPMRSVDSKVAITEASEMHSRVEIREPGTAPGMGQLVVESPWDAATRVVSTRRPGSDVRIQIVDKSADRLVIDYEAPIPIDTIDARWIASSEYCSGSVRVTKGRTGRATVKNREYVGDERRFSSPEYPKAVASTAVSLHRSSSEPHRIFEWRDVHESPEPNYFFRSTTPRRTRNVFLFALPRTIAPGTEMRFFYRSTNDGAEIIPASEITMQWHGGSSSLERAQALVGDFKPRVLRVPREAVAKVEGPVLEVTVTFDERTAPEDANLEAFLEVVEKKR